MIPSAAALFCTRRTRLMMLSSDVPGNACFSSLTKKSDASARWARPKSESARKTSGTNESSAKYATIAARCVPRSAKNFCTSWRRRIAHGCEVCTLIAVASDGGGSALSRISSRSRRRSRRRRSCRRGRRAGRLGRRPRGPRRRPRARGAGAARGRRGVPQRRGPRHPGARVARRRRRVRRGRADEPAIVAVTAERATPGLVFYDLKRCLAAVGRR